MRAGDTFRLKGVADRHTWVIISDPEIDEKCVLLVSFTGYYPGMDPSCIVGRVILSIMMCLGYHTHERRRGHETGWLIPQGSS
jgi:hypothetical protein